MIETTINIWKKSCPTCNSGMVYASVDSLTKSIKKNCQCGSCARSGENNPQYGKMGTNTGKKFSEDHKQKISKSRMGSKHWFYGKHLSEDHRKNQSESLKNKYITDPLQKITRSVSMTRYYSDASGREKTSELVKLAMHRPDVRKRHIEALHHSKWIKVRTDRGQLEMIKKWNQLGFQFEPNYQVHTDVDLFYVDGYDKQRNVVLEYDSKYHNKPYQQKRDLIRQNKIIDILKPKKFWRYDATNKKFRNVLERSR